MSITQYKLANGQKFWRVREWLKQPDGTATLFIKSKIPTQEMAKALVAKNRAEAFSGRYFPERRKPAPLTFAEAWALYSPTAERNDSFGTDRARAARLLEHLGTKSAAALSPKDVEDYRAARRQQRTRRGGPPSDATLDREVELLKRVLNTAVAFKRLEANPLAAVGLLNTPNVRETVLDESEFARLHAAADEGLKPLLLVAFDTGMRLGEILNLKWRGDAQANGVDLDAGVVRLAAAETKSEKPRAVWLTARVVEALKQVPRSSESSYVFLNPTTGKPWQDIRCGFRRACATASLTGIWFHDLRRSFVTKARRAGVPESVVMRFSGHRTRAVFDRYNVIEDDAVQEAMRRIEAAARQHSQVADAPGHGGP